jgi:hypothetical protein
MESLKELNKRAKKLGMWVGCFMGTYTIYWLESPTGQENSQGKLSDSERVEHAISEDASEISKLLDEFESRGDVTTWRPARLGLWRPTEQTGFNEVM